MTRIIGFCSPLQAASDHRVVTRSLSCLPMAIDTYMYIRRACTKIILDQVIPGHTRALRLAAAMKVVLTSYLSTLPGGWRLSLFVHS